MPDITAQVIIPPKSVVTDDQVVNTFAFIGNETAVNMALLAFDMLEQLYANTPTTGTKSIADWLSPALDVTQARVKFFDLSDPSPRVPILDEPFTIATPSTGTTASMPAEVSLVATFYALAESGVPVQRRRGRSFMGPWSALANGTTANTPSRPHADLQNDLALSFETLMEVSNADCSWGVYSRADGVVRPVVGGWVDNAWDTQRRRGVSATNRVTWESA